MTTHFPGIFCMLVLIKFGLCISSTVDTNVSLHIYPESLVVAVGSNVTFNCSVDGILPPKASIKWYKAQCKDSTDALVSNDTIQLSDGTAQLVLDSVQLEDSKPGYYSCCVVLEDGRCNHKMEEHVRLRVGYIPEPVQGLTCFSHSIYTGHCVWNDTATNSNLETRYLLQRSFHNQNEWEPVDCKDNYPPPSGVQADHICTVEDDDKNYNYRVVSVNALGESSSPQSASFNVNQHAIPYHPPTDVIITPTSTSKAKIEWTQPDNFPEYFLQYRLRYNTSINQDWILHSESLWKNKAELKDLHPPYANICVQISARNKNQLTKKWGLWSDSQCTRLLEDIPAAGPSFKRQEPEENEEDEKNLKDVTLIWEHIPENKRNGKILGYNITVKGYLDDLYEDRWIHYLSANETQYKLEGLNRTYRYDVSLTANNSMGISPITNITITATPYKQKMSPIESKSFIPILVTLIITAVMLTIFILYCSWKKLNKDRFPDPKIPDIVTQSHTYRNTDYMKFHTQEPEQFDAVDPEFDSPLLHHDDQDEQNTAQMAAVLILDGVGQTQHRYSYRSDASNGAVKSDRVVYKQLTPEGLSPIDPQWCDGGGKPTFTGGDSDGVIIYKTLTPQGLSPVDKDLPENHWDMKLIRETTQGISDTGSSIVPYVCAASANHRGSLHHGQSSSQDITGHYLPDATSRSRASSLESEINSYTQHGQAAMMMNSDDMSKQVKPHEQQSTDKMSHCPKETRLQNSHSCDEIDPYTKHSEIPRMQSCNNSPTFSPKIGLQSNDFSPIKTRRNAHLTDLIIGHTIKSCPNEETLSETNNTQVGDVANYVKAGKSLGRVQTHASASSSSKTADEVADYVKSAVKQGDFNITENPLTVGHCEGHINGYVSAQNLRNRQGSDCSSDSSASVPSCCVSSGNTNRVENRDSRSSTCSSMDSQYKDRVESKDSLSSNCSSTEYVAQPNKNGAGFCTGTQLDCKHTTVLDMEPSGTNCLEISPNNRALLNSEYVDNTIKLGHVNEPSISITVSSSGTSSLHSSNEELYTNSASIPLLPSVTTDFNDNLTPTNMLPKTFCSDGYTPISDVMQVCRIPSPRTLEDETQSPLLIAHSDDGYSSHGNNSPPDSPNMQRSDKNITEEPIESMYPQSQVTPNPSQGYISVSAL